MTEQVNPTTKDVLDPDILNNYAGDDCGLEEVEVLINFDLSKIPHGKLFKLEQLLDEMGIHFDTGTDFRTRDWEWDWSLSGPVKVFFKKLVKDNPTNRYKRHLRKPVIEDPNLKDDEEPTDAKSTDS